MAVEVNRIMAEEPEEPGRRPGGDEAGAGGNAAMRLIEAVIQTAADKLGVPVRRGPRPARCARSAAREPSPPPLPFVFPALIPPRPPGPSSDGEQCDFAALTFGGRRPSSRG